MDDSTSISSIDFLNNSYHGKNFLKRMSNQDRHAELFRKDLISAMKMPDSETLQPDDYFEIIDSWKLEWERGVQVPVNVNAFTPKVSVVSSPQDSNDEEMFMLPKKLLFSGSILDDSFKPLVHELYDLQKQVNAACRYDLDELDSTWLEIFNRTQGEMGEPALLELDMEKVMEEMELQCHSKMNEAVRSIEGLGIEYDENVVCDICRSPEGEESNEMVFCDNCDICVHQACYGIQNIPEGSWLCRTCALGIKPKCVLCPMVGGAMKSTKNGDKWAHISCALWVPEVSIGCPEKMEPITNISQIPASRWALVCTLCRERSGACIQCSVRSCKTSFHVTCAFKYGLDLSTVIDDETEDVQMKAYCPKHSGVESSIPNLGGNSESGLASGEGGTITVDVPEPLDKLKDGSDRKSKRNKDGLTEEQRTEIRSQKLKRLAEDFYTFVDVHEASQNLGLPLDVIDAVHAYWTLKRKSRFDAALVAIKTEEEESSTPCQGEEKLVERMKMFIQLRQDLERVRNLCYMVNKREKMKKHERRIKEEIFHRQVNLYSRFLMDEEADEDLQISNGISGRKFHLSDSDDEDEDEDFANFIRAKSCGKNVVSKFLAAIDSDDNSHSHYGDDDVINDGHSKREAIKTKRIESLSEERNFLLSAHKSTGTIYDMPSYVLSCSFKENNFLYNDRNFIKSAVAAGHPLDDDDDDDEIFPKSFKYDMKIDDESLDNFCSIASIRGRGRPRKNKRGRPPRISNTAVEEDDSDYYRRLSDEDFDEESDKFSASKSAKALDPTPPLPVTLPEKKKRGRKKKSELLAAGSSVKVVKSKTAKRKSGEQAPESRKKRKYTRRKVVKVSSPKNESKDKDLTKEEEVKEDEDDFKNASSLGSCPGILGRSAFLGDANEGALGSDVEQTNVLFSPNRQSDKEIESDDEILCKEKNSRFIPSDDDDEEDVDPEVKARREKAAELLKDMEFSDSSTEEEMNFEVKSPADDNTEADDVIVYDVDSQDALEPVLITNEPITEKQDTKEEITSMKCSADHSSLNNDKSNDIPLNLAQPLRLGSPSSPLFSSSEDEASDIDDDKHDSKVTGIVNKELLNINARHKLLHKLPIKDFIVSSHIKNMVQNFFSNLGSTSVPSASKLAFNGFKLPQGKIEC